jgi:hypothetical protein
MAVAYRMEPLLLLLLGVLLLGKTGKTDNFPWRLCCVLNEYSRMNRYRSRSKGDGPGKAKIFKRKILET